MTPAVFAYECYADGDVLEFLRVTCGLPLRGDHARSQGNVVNKLRDGRARIGLVDEDPHGPHHRWRDAMTVVSSTADLEWRRHGDRHLVVVKPELEPCLLRTFARVQLDSKLPTTPGELHRLLNVPNPRKHELLRRELAEAHQRAVARRVATFTTELEGVVRAMLSE